MPLMTLRDLRILAVAFTLGVLYASVVGAGFVYAANVRASEVSRCR
jgi:hypothetical protein